MPYIPLIPANRSTSDILQSILDAIVNPLIGFMFVLAFLLFLWGVFQFLMNGAESEEREKGKKNLLYGVIGMFIMVSAVAIVNVIKNTVALP